MPFSKDPVKYQQQMKRLSDAHKGFRVSEVTKKRIAETHKKRGMATRLINHVKKHGAWNKGMTGLGGYKWSKPTKTPEVLKARMTVKYKLWRLAVYERDNFTCQMCGQKGGDLNADHIMSFAHFPELRYELSNGRTLCHPCHRKTPNYGRKNKIQQQANGGRSAVKQPATMGG